MLSKAKGLVILITFWRNLLQRTPYQREICGLTHLLQMCRFIYWTILRILKSILLLYVSVVFSEQMYQQTLIKFCFCQTKYKSRGYRGFLLKSISFSQQIYFS